MPFYNPVRDWSSEDRQRTIRNLKTLRKQIRAEIPARTLKQTLLLATWNIRDFGNEDKRAKRDGTNRPGPRLDESFYYIAEIISAFDVVAIQEVNSMTALRRVMRILGPSWDYMTTDINPAAGGNEERMTFIFDTRKVRFNHTVGQVVTDSPKQLLRTPFYAAFQSGWFKISLCTVHILYGDFKDTSDRIREIVEIAGFLSERAKRTGENIVLLGDFNILSRTDDTFEPLDEHGWTVPAAHMVTNVAGSKAYDQIAFKVKPDELRFGPSDPNAGAFKLFKHLFRLKDWEAYYETAKATGRPMKSWDATRHWKTGELLSRKQYFKDWRTWQVSDHVPLWLELEIDFTESYLDRISQGG